MRPDPADTLSPVPADPAETEREVHVVRSGTHFYLGTGWVPVARELSLEPGEQVCSTSSEGCSISGVRVTRP